MILVTGGAGFIGANFVLDWLHGSEEAVLNVDALTYAGNLGTLKSQQDNARHVFARANICDRAAMDALLAEHKPRAILHFAAESHVDRSIHGPADFVQTNVVGTFTLLEATRAYWSALSATPRKPRSVSCTSRPTKCSARCPLPIRNSPKPRRTRRIAPIRPPRRVPTIWCAPTITRMACRC